jgi:transcription elongation GreA/GreB family factor
MARALLGKRIGDEAQVKTPLGEQFWVINDIQYPHKHPA